MFKLGLPVNHSGQNVIHLKSRPRLNVQRTALNRDKRDGTTHPPYNSAVLNTMIQ